MFSKFLIGEIRIAPEVRKVLGREPLDLVARHAVCEFGDISRRQQKVNEVALAEGLEIVSEYAANPTDPTFGRIRITTANGWGETTVSWIKPQPHRRKKHDTTF